MSRHCEQPVLMITASAAAAFVLIKSVKTISIQNTRKNHRAVSAQSANLIVFQIDINWKLCKVDTIL